MLSDAHDLYQGICDRCPKADGSVRDRGRDDGLGRRPEADYLEMLLKGPAKMECDGEPSPVLTFRWIFISCRAYASWRTITQRRRPILPDGMPCHVMSCLICDDILRAHDHAPNTPRYS